MLEIVIATLGFLFTDGSFGSKLSNAFYVVGLLYAALLILVVIIGLKWSSLFGTTRSNGWRFKETCAKYNKLFVSNVKAYDSASALKRVFTSRVVTIVFTKTVLILYIAKSIHKDMLFISDLKPETFVAFMLLVAVQAQRLSVALQGPGPT